MSLMTRAYILDKYGMRLSMEQLADVLGWAQQTIYNQLQREVFPIPTYRDGPRRYASYEDVADYFDQQAERARREHEKKPGHVARVPVES